MAAVDAGRYALILDTLTAEPPRTVEITFESLVRQCNDGADNDEDAAIDLLDPGCELADDDDEADDDVVGVAVVLLPLLLVVEC